LRIFQAGLDTGQRRVGIKRQPGGAGLGDGRLHHQQVDAAWQPQAHDLARADAGFDQARCGQAGGIIELGIAQRPHAIDQRSLVGHTFGGGFQQVGENFVADEVRPMRPCQQGRPQLAVQCIGRESQACRFDIGWQVQRHYHVRQENHSLANEGLGG
jgi:hypothetical protein